MYSLIYGRAPTDQLCTLVRLFYPIKYDDQNTKELHPLSDIDQRRFKSSGYGWPPRCSDMRLKLTLGLAFVLIGVLLAIGAALHGATEETMQISLGDVLVRSAAGDSCLC